MNIRTTNNRNTHLFDLYWEDIIVANVLPYLSLNDCFNFRSASKTCVQIIDLYLGTLKSLKLMHKGFSPHTFRVFTVNCTKLTELNLARCVTIRDVDIIPLLLQNKGLTSLNLSQCSNLSAKSLQPVILYCNHLETLKLGRCSWLTTGAVEALALHQSNLVDVDLSHCPSISESCILIFIKKFRNLKTFNLEGNQQVSDKLLFTLAKYSKDLKLLNLVGCSEITDKGIRAIGLHCKKLQGLLVRGCGQVSELSLMPLRAKTHLDRKPPQLLPRNDDIIRRALIERLRYPAGGSPLVIRISAAEGEVAAAGALPEPEAPQYPLSELAAALRDARLRHSDDDEE